jgi:apolipoprotein D and lipocalin family protein
MMKWNTMLHLGLLSSLLLGFAPPDPSAPLSTVASVDLNRYLGKWYEIARYPNRFEKDCASDVTATYSLRDDGKINVINSCRKADGSVKQSKGYAKVVDQASRAKLKVTFFWPFYGDYWIVDLDPDYRYVVVSEPKREYLWILSRTSRMDPTQYQRVIERIRQLGFDPTKLVTSEQSGK